MINNDNEIPFINPQQHPTPSPLGLQQFERVIPMLIPLVDLQIIYSKILQQINLSYTSVLIFSAFDVDAVCSLKIITGILKTQNISYQVYPVASYLELEEKIEDSRALERIKMIFFINCGGGMDLTEKWFYTEREQDRIRLFLLDIHKPIHHANIAFEHIKIINDGLSNFEKCPTKKDFRKLNEIEEELKEQSDQEELYEEEEGEGEGEGEQEKLDKEQPARSDNNQGENVENQSNQENSLNDKEKPLDESYGVLNKKEIKQRKLREKKKERQMLSKKIDDYYGRQYIGLPSSLIAYRLARDVNKSSNDYLWFGMIGLSSLLQDSKISKKSYDWCEAFFSTEMMKLNPVSSTKSTTPDVGSISKQMDFRFTLLKHWSLYQSIQYSPYMVAKMRLWSEDGKRTLSDFITKIGISQDQAKQHNAFMLSQTLNDFKKEILKKAEEFQLFDVCFMSFKRKIDNFDVFSATDYSCALTAALETFDPKEKSFSKTYEWRKECFWTAYKLLDTPKIQDIKKQINNYKEWTKTMIKQALSILQKSQINPCQKFLYVKFLLDNPERQMFSHPFRLIRFAQFLMHLYHQKKHHKPPTIKPLVVSAESEESETCTVVGVVADAQNPFGQDFIDIVEKNNFQRRHDLFLSNIIELRKEDLLKFIGQLNLV